jgi:cytochrome c-type biogenesis protein CcmF
MASLHGRSWDPGWVRHALPCALVGWLTLGTGIIMGGFWAYKVLGWGGWWGWDPVENASLLPWLTATALIHGMLLQRIRSKLARTNIVLAVVTFVLVIYSTYLTRSGALEGASVHTFGTSAVGPWILLWLLVTLLYGMGRFLKAALGSRQGQTRLEGDPLDEPLASREMLVALGAVVLVAITVVVGLGTSAPILTRLAGQGSAAIDVSFYDRATLPLGILLALGLGFSVLLRWKGSGTVSRNALLIAAGTGVLGLAVAWQMGIRQVPHMLFAGSSLFALTANLLVFERALWQGGWKQAGGYVAHVGIAFMLVAVVSAGAGSKQKVDLPFQTPVRVMGYELTFEGWRDEQQDKRSTVIRMQRPGGGAATYLRPKLYQQYGSGQMMTRAEPDIRRRLASDLYVAPAQFLPPSEALAGQGSILTLQRGEPLEADGIRFTFEGFEMGGPHGGSDADPHGMAGAAAGTVGARIKVEGPWGAEVVVPRLSMTGDGEGEPAPLPGEEGKDVRLKGIDADNGLVRVLVTTAGVDVDGRAIGGLLTIEISTKPMMTVLWSGVILALLGGCLALWRRVRQLPA